MSRFYDLYEQVTRDIYQGLPVLVREALSSEIDPKLTNLELECRFKTASSEKYRGMIEKIIGVREDMDRTPKDEETKDENFDSRPYTLRKTIVTGVGGTQEYLKMKIFPRKNSQLSKAMAFFEEMGMKLSVSFEIQDSRLFKERFQRLNPPNSHTRLKSRRSYLHVYSQTSLDLTRVVENERYGFEVEADKTIPLVSFLNQDSQAMIKHFLHTVDIFAREIVYQSRTPLPFPVLEECLTKINRGLGYVKTDDKPTYKIQKLIPQVRNLQITDLLKEGYRGYAVTPKADGYRYFMVVLEFFIVLVQPPNIYKTIYEGPGIPKEWVGFIFDGELVDKENWKPSRLTPEFVKNVDNYYCVFDILGYPSTGFSEADRGDVLMRINRLKTFFEEVRRSPGGVFTWDKALDLIHIKARNNFRLPPMITALEIKPYDDASHSPWAASTAFFETLRPRLRYQDDGLIFTPLNRSYRELVETPSLKWKPMDMLSIDFQYRAGGELLVMDGDSLVPFNGTRAFPLQKKIEFYGVREPLVDGNIYEFVYEPHKSGFRFTRSRPDKAIPNRLSDASQVWTDIHIPIDLGLICGKGNSGMIECMKEGLWSWFLNLHRWRGLESMSVIVDLTGIQPLADFPVRAFDEGLGDIFKNVVVYRDSSLRYVLDFPNVVELTGGFEGHVDVLVLNNIHLSMIEGRNVTYHPNPEKVAEEMEKITRLLPRARYVFIRGLCSIETDEFFVPEMKQGQEEDLVLRMVEDHGLELEYKPGGLFPSSLKKMIAYPRSLSKSFPCVSSGHRILADFSDNGPENVLGNPRFGRLWDFMYNCLVPGEYVEGLIPRPTLMADTSIPELEDMFHQISLDPLPKPPPAQTLPKSTLITDVELRTILKTVDVERSMLEPITLDPATAIQPEIGDVYAMICKGIYLLRESTNYDSRLVERSERELRVLFPPTLSVEELTKGVFERLGVSIIFVRRTSPGLSLESYRSVFEKSILSPPGFGFLVIEALNTDLELTSRCRIVSYRGKFLIHPADPIIPMLYKQGLRTIRMEEETYLSPSRPSRVKVKTFGEDKSWPSAHRLFMVSSFLQVSREDPLYGYVREYVELVRTESTDNKAYYLVSQKIPKRFEKQTWAKELRNKIDWAISKGIKAVAFEENPEEHARNFSRMVAVSDKAREELKTTGLSFLYDKSLPGNIYGLAYMIIRGMN